MRTFKLLLLICSIVLVSSCNIINPDEAIPAYIVVEEFNVETSFSTEGTSDHKITELWVYANGEYVGAYDVPADIPVLQSGSKEIAIFPGIKNNGISATRVVYPFFEPIRTTVNLEPGEDHIINPEFRYRENLDIWMENFDDPGIKFAPGSLSDTSIQVVNDEALLFSHPGETNIGSGAVYTNQEKNYFFSRTEEGIDMTPGQQIYCELNYKCNNSFVVGVEAVNVGGTEKAAALVVLPTNDDANVPVWNKIYVDFSFVVGNLPNALAYNIYLESYLDAGNTDGVIYLDNVKVIRFD